jgi:hypothetical protein
MSDDWRYHPDRKCAPPADMEGFVDDLRRWHNQWFPKNETRDYAKALCAGCPVKAECLTDALETGDVGIRGGTTTYARKIATKRKSRRRVA